MAFGLLGICLILGMIVFAIIQALKEEEEDMFKQLYVYLVLFATLMMSIGGGISIFMNVAELVSPAPYYQTFEDYKQMLSYNEEGKKTIVPEKETRAAYDQMVKEEKERAKSSALNALVKSFGFIVIPLPIFLYFNRTRGKKEEKEA